LHPVHAAAGIPLYITLLFPFLSRDEVTAMHERRLAELFAATQPLAFSLVSIAAFPAVAYAVPSPDDRLRELMRVVWDAFPDTPPYGGAFADPAPHATLALVQAGEAPDEAAGRVAARVEGRLPLRCVVQDVSLMEEYEPDRWREARSFSLGSAEAR
jgi:hypothetical protein